MKTENYTNLSLSKYLSEKMTFESEIDKTTRYYCGGHTWYEDDEKGKFEVCDETEPVIQDDEYCESAGMTCEKVYRAFSFTDLLHWLKLYGDGKEDMNIQFGAETTTINLATETMHDLLSAYIADNLTIGTNVESFLLDVIK